MCNNWIKFGKLFDYADSVGARYVATGHYARLVGGPERVDWALHRGHDADKDQSYVLFGVARDYLPRMLLPVGGYRKQRDPANGRRAGAARGRQADSQEICFVEAGRHAEFVAAASSQARDDGAAKS